MSKTEDYIKKSTRRCQEGDRPYNEWVSVDCAKEATEIAREEMIDWVDKHWREYINVDADGVVCFGHWKNDLRKAMKDK